MFIDLLTLELKQLLTKDYDHSFIYTQLNGFKYCYLLLIIHY